MKRGVCSITSNNLCRIEIWSFGSKNHEIIFELIILDILSFDNESGSLIENIISDDSIVYVNNIKTFSFTIMY